MLKLWSKIKKMFSQIDYIFDRYNKIFLKISRIEEMFDVVQKMYLPTDSVGLMNSPCGLGRYISREVIVRNEKFEIIAQGKCTRFGTIISNSLDNNNNIITATKDYISIENSKPIIMNNDYTIIIVK